MCVLWYDVTCRFRTQAEDAFSVIEPDDLSDEDEEVQDAVNAIFAELLPQAAAPTPAAAVAATPAPAQPAAAAAADINPLLLVSAWLSQLCFASSFFSALVKRSGVVWCDVASLHGLHGSAGGSIAPRLDGPPFSLLFLFILFRSC